jgi:hypothetical protein
VQITRTTPLRRMILQLRHIFLTEAATFMVFSLTSSFGAEHDPRTTQILGCQLYGHFVPGQDPDVVHPYLSGDVTQNHMPVFQSHPEYCIREVFDNLPLLLDDIILGPDISSP